MTLNNLLDRRFGIHVILGAIVLLVFGAALANGYSLDDNFVLNERTETGFAGIPKLMKSHYYNFYGQIADYRPIVMISFAIEHDIHGNNMVLGHLTNLILYFFTLLFAYRFLSGLFPNHRLINLIAIAIFAVHPLHVEVVASLKNRDELLAAFFGFWACVVFMKDVASKPFINRVLKWTFLYILLVLSFFSKSTAFMFIGILGLTIIAKSNSIKTIAVNVLPLISPLIINKFVRAKLVGHTNKRINSLRENPLYVDPVPLLDKIPLACNIVVEYIGLFVWPSKLRFYYGYNQVEFAGWSDFAGVFGVVIVLGLIVIAIRYWKTHLYLSYGVLFFIGTALLVSNFFKPLPGIMAERFVFVPILGLSMTLAYVVILVFRSEKYTIKGIKYIGIAALAVLSIKSIYRTTQWKNIMTLMSADIEHMQESAIGNYMYAEEITNNPEYLEQYTIEQKAEYYKRAYTVDSTYKEAYFGAGMVYANAVRNSKMRMQQDKNYYVDGNILKNYTQLALDNIGAAIRIDTLFAEGIYAVGVISNINGNYDIAAQAFEKAYNESDGRLLVAHEELLRILLYQRKYDKAMEICWTGMRKHKKQAMYYTYAGYCKSYLNESDSALHYFKLSYRRHQSLKVEEEIKKLENSNENSSNNPVNMLQK